LLTASTIVALGKAHLHREAAVAFHDFVNRLAADSLDRIQDISRIETVPRQRV
jgi:hypothetical protein